MPLTTPDIKVSLSDNDTCASLFFTDTTGAYNAATNPLGYGLPGGLTTADVTSFRVLITFNTLGTTAYFLFTVVSNTITVATLSFAAATPVNILSSLLNATFPFDVTNPFNVYRAYGVTLPTLEDGSYSVNYSITGTAAATPFSYTAAETILIKCNTEKCIRTAFLDTGLEDPELQKAYKADSYLKVATYSADEGNYTNAATILTKAADLCNCDCGCQ